jgi:hypothetical protein
MPAQNPHAEPFFTVERCGFDSFLQIRHLTLHGLLLPGKGSKGMKLACFKILMFCDSDLALRLAPISFAAHVRQGLTPAFLIGAKVG